VSLLKGHFSHPRLTHCSLYSGSLCKVGEYPVPEGPVPDHFQDRGGNLEVLHLPKFRYDLEQAGGGGLTSHFSQFIGFDIKELV
jgi:hypothetical protein